MARGQAYYTGVVFEFFDTNSLNSRSLLGGGRYDNLTALFGDSDLPAVGFGMGDVTIKDFLETRGLLPVYSPSTQLFVAIADQKITPRAIEIVVSIRKKNINVAVDFTGRKLGDQIKAADKLKIPFVMVIGENEIKDKKFSIKELASGKETEVTMDEISDLINLK